MPDRRLTYRRRKSYNTRSNKVKVVKTPANRLVYQYLSKKVKGPSCGDCGKKLNGIPALRPTKLRALGKRQRTVTRPYGGSRCARCTKERILRAFLIEEQKIVKKLLKESQSKKKGKKPKAE
eukprot:TRINITY_DN1043_c0_g1_i1.p1 TRINITY_DN1043_c0_g1~~TRINITY_DN1043_c0_g1_i1.p1  ORF type:complete len:122 (+),score=18.98 TRINITY_DN1043_c0_g1_i1:77-442(+)